jgi:hypothetical protein
MTIINYNRVRQLYIFLILILILHLHAIFYPFDPFILNNYQICGIFDYYHRKRQYSPTGKTVISPNQRDWNKSYHKPEDVLPEMHPLDYVLPMWG